MKPTADRFRCGEGWLVLAVLTDAQFERLLRTIGREDALADPRFVDWFTRIEHAQALRAIIESALEGGDPRTWERRLSEADVPCAVVTSIPEIVEHPQVAHRGQLQRVETPFGPVTLAGPAFRLAHGNGGIDRPIATPGADVDAVLAEIGYDAPQIAALRERQVV
jgi:crotonobetainyl-CoA:carnitine CoA-transferase CaiB-like acyl-CoA transferase